MDALTNIIENYGYLALFFAMLLEGMCIPVFSELVLGFSGYLVFRGQFFLAYAVIVGTLGSLGGSTIVYFIARTGGRTVLLRWGHFVRLTPQRLDKMEYWFLKYGPKLIIPWRQLPFIRTKISIAAGLFNLPFITFFTYTAIGIFLWCLLTVSGGYHLGGQWKNLINIFVSLGHYVIAALIIISVALVSYFVQRRKRLIKQDES